jgi:hypothetical protein
MFRKVPEANPDITNDADLRSRARRDRTEPGLPERADTAANCGT